MHPMTIAMTSQCSVVRSRGGRLIIIICCPDNRNEKQEKQRRAKNVVTSDRCHSNLFFFPMIIVRPRGIGSTNAGSSGGLLCSVMYILHLLSPST